MPKIYCWNKQLEETKTSPPKHKTEKLYEDLTFCQAANKEMNSYFYFQNHDKMWSAGLKLPLQTGKVGSETSVLFFSVWDYPSNLKFSK